MKEVSFGLGLKGGQHSEGWWWWLHSWGSCT